MESELLITLVTLGGGAAVYGLRVLGRYVDQKERNIQDERLRNVLDAVTDTVFDVAEVALKETAEGLKEAAKDGSISRAEAGRAFERGGKDGFKALNAAAQEKLIKRYGSRESAERVVEGTLNDVARDVQKRVLGRTGLNPDEAEALLRSGAADEIKRRLGL